MQPRSVAAVLAGLGITAVTVLIGAAPASAHSYLVGSTPAAGSVVVEEPSGLRLEFSEPVEVSADAIRVTAPDGATLTVTRTRADPTDRTVVLARLPRELQTGTHVVHWQVLSIDGHPVRGEFRFGNQTQTTPVASGVATDDNGPSGLTMTGRALAVAGALAVSGLAAFPIVVMAPARRRLSEKLAAALDVEATRRLRVPLLVALAAGLVGSVLTALDTAARTSAGADAGDLVAFLVGTRTGLLLDARVVLLLAAGLLLIPRNPRARVRTTRVVAGLVAALLALVTFSLSSHAAAVPVDQTIAVGFDVLHLVAAALWAGGLLGLALGGIPGARTVGGSNRRDVGDAAGALSGSFSVAAQLAMLAVLTTGGYLALVQVSALEELTETSWGVALTIKVALFVTLLMFASANAITFVPRLAQRAAKAKQRLVAADELRSAVRLELLGAGALIAVAAVMSATAPPASVAAASTAIAAQNTRQQSSTGSAAGYRTEVVVTRSGRGPSAATVFRVSLTTQGTRASSPLADALLRGTSGVARGLSLQLVGEGEWVSDRLAVEPGRYRFTARFQRAGATVSIPVDVRVPS